ncbi:hypothetical protein SFRURICE_006882, partial [Spodoptera frugiperda]
KLLICASFIRVFTIRGLKKCDPIPIFAVKISLFADRIEISKVQLNIFLSTICFLTSSSRNVSPITPYKLPFHIHGLSHTQRIKSFYCNRNESASGAD